MKAKNLAITKFSLAILFLVLAGFWVVKSTQPFNGIAYIILGVVLLVVGVMIYSGFQALQDARNGLNPVDERSRKLTQKAAAIAFQVSIYMWLFSLLLLDRLAIDSVVETKFVIAFGMMLTGVIFILTRMYLSKSGVDDHED